MRGGCLSVYVTIVGIADVPPGFTESVHTPPLGGRQVEFDGPGRCALAEVSQQHGALPSRARLVAKERPLTTIGTLPEAAAVDVGARWEWLILMQFGSRPAWLPRRG